MLKKLLAEAGLDKAMLKDVLPESGEAGQSQMAHRPSPGQHQVSQHRACRGIPISRKTVRHEPTRPQEDSPLVARLRVPGKQYPRYGYLMLRSLLRADTY